MCRRYECEKKKNRPTTETRLYLDNFIPNIFNYLQGAKVF